MIWLICSVVILILGPLLYYIADRFPVLLKAVDMFTIAAVVGLIFFLVMPHILEHGGWTALLPALIGFAGPFVLEWLIEEHTAQIHQSILVLLLIGLSIHAFFDGVALKIFITYSSGDELPLAIVLHRSADGLAIWKVLKENYWSAWTGLISLAMVTVLGYSFGGFFKFDPHGINLVYFEAFVAGTLLHVISHYHTSIPNDKT